MRAPLKGYRTFMAMYSNCECVVVCTSVHVYTFHYLPFMRISVCFYKYVHPNPFTIPTSFFSAKSAFSKSLEHPVLYVCQQCEIFIAIATVCCETTKEKGLETS